MLFTQKLAEEAAMIDVDFNIEEEEHQFAFESMLTNFDINRIACEAELVAIEAYKEYNGNMSVLESQFEIVREEAEQGIVEKIKGWITRAWEWIKSMFTKFKNWIVGLFSKQKAFVNKYKDDDTQVTAEIYDFDKVKSKIVEYSNEATVIAEKVKEYHNKSINSLVPVPDDGQSVSDFIEKNKSLFGFTHSFESAEKVAEIMNKDIDAEKKSATFKMKDFVSKLEAFAKVKDDVNTSTFTKKMAKLAMEVKVKASPKDNGIMKPKTIFGIVRDVLGICLKIMSTYMTIIKKVINSNMEAVQKAYPKKEESK